MQFTVSFHKGDIHKTSKQNIDSVHQEECMSYLVVTLLVFQTQTYAYCRCNLQHYHFTYLLKLELFFFKDKIF